MQHRGVSPRRKEAALKAGLHAEGIVHDACVVHHKKRAHDIEHSRGEPGDKSRAQSAVPLVPQADAPVLHIEKEARQQKNQSRKDPPQRLLRKMEQAPYTQPRGHKAAAERQQYLPEPDMAAQQEHHLQTDSHHRYRRDGGAGLHGQHQRHQRHGQHGVAEAAGRLQQRGGKVDGGDHGDQRPVQIHKNASCGRITRRAAGTVRLGSCIRRLLF